jgi:hypothetical protein
MAKYRIIDDNLYNFDETGFMMGMIAASMVVTRVDTRERPNLCSLVTGNGQQRLNASMQRAGVSRHS